MKTMCRRMLATTLTVVLGMSAALRAQVLDQVPADALVVLKIKNLGATSTKLGKFLQDLGVAGLQPGLDDPLKFLQTKANIQQGLNKDGDFAFVYRDSATSGAPDEKSVMILIPVSDYKAFIANFQGAKTEGEVSEVTMPNSGEPSYLAKWGDFAALSPSKEVISAKPSAMMKLSGAVTTKELGAKDVVLLANFAALRTKLLPPLQQNREKILAEAEQNLMKQDATAKFVPVLKVAITKALDMAESFVKDTNAVAFSLNFGAEGINTSLLAEFEPNSYMANLATQMKGTNEPLLKGLPAGKYLFFGGSKNDPKLAAKVIDDVSAPVVKELLAMGPQYQPVADYVESLKAFFSANEGNTTGVVAPSGQLGQEAIIQFLSIQKGDVAAMKTAQAKMVSTQQEAMKAFGLPADAYKATIAQNAKTVDGVTFDSITTTMNGDPNSPMAAQQQQAMAMMYGPAGMVQLVGDTGNGLLIASGVSDTVLSSALAAAKGGSAPMADNAGVKSVAGNLPQSRLAEVYVPVDEIVTTGLGYARQFGAPVNIQLPPDLPPIGAAVATEGTAIRVDGYVPSALVQSLVAAGMQVMMQMQGGGGNGGGGGGGL